MNGSVSESPTAPAARVAPSRGAPDVASGLPPVVLVGLDSMQGLQAARELHGRGVRVIAIAADRGHHACRTRACERVVIADTGGAELVKVLSEIAEDLAEPALLLPAQDKCVRVISANRDRLGQDFTFVLPPPAVVDLLMDKDAFYAYAAEKRLPIPKTLDLVDRHDAERAARELDFPCLLKPRTRTKDWDRNTRLKVFKVASPEALLEQYDRCSPWADGLVAQQWIEGGDGSLYSCNCYLDRDGRPLVSFVARKLRQWPPEAGSSCLGEEVRNDVVLETTLALFESVGYRGLGYVEIKQDARTGAHYIIEANVGRPTGRSAIAEAGGVPLLYTAYCDAMGLPLPEDRTQRYSGAKWIDLRHDLQSALWYWRRGRLTLSEWASSLRGRKAYAVLSFRDPAPFVFDLLRAVAMAAGRVRGLLRS